MAAPSRIAKLQSEIAAPGPAPALARIWADLADNRVAFRISTHAMYSDKSAIDEMFREITKAASARQPAPPLERNSQSSLSPLSPFCGSEKAMIASPTLPASGSTMLKLFRSGTLPPKA